MLGSLFTSDSKVASAEDDTVHVFSLASGHLYERFLKIMMLSVTKVGAGVAGCGGGWTARMLRLTLFRPPPSQSAM
jgi:hypothetical protein